MDPCSDGSRISRIGDPLDVDQTYICIGFVKVVPRSASALDGLAGVAQQQSTTSSMRWSSD